MPCRAVPMGTVTRTAAAEEASGRRRERGRQPPASEGLAAADEVVGRSARRPSPPRMKAVAAANEPSAAHTRRLSPPELPWLEEEEREEGVGGVERAARVGGPRGSSGCEGEGCFCR